MRSLPLHVLFLCTGNSARSILAEHLLRHLDAGRQAFRVESAGAEPTGEVHPMAIEVLREDYGISAATAWSKSIREIDQRGVDLVVTVCDHARDACPVFPAAPMQVHWRSSDPAALGGTPMEVRKGFRRVAREIEGRLRNLCALPADTLVSVPTAQLQQCLQEMGR